MATEPDTVLRRDPVLADVVERHTLPTIGECDEYERLCVSIVNQQLSTASATAVRERVVDCLGGEVTTAAVLDAERAALREAGLSRTKVDYLRNAARAFERNDFSREGLAGYDDEEVVDRLTEITGVGEWTANMYLLFVLERPDVLPLGDLAVRRGIEALYNDGAALARAEMREIAEPWRPYRSRATRYIWAEYEADG